MKYRLTALTPLLVGDGRRLSPIDYMVWKDQVNVLDQWRIFRLLARGPRLDGYLAQLKKAEKLDFASWGGFAQNYADRRVPFEHSSAARYWEKLRSEHLFIPTFHAGAQGAYLPGSAIKGALRTAWLFTRFGEGALRVAAARLAGERGWRNPGTAAEEHAMGGGRVSRMKTVSVGDSAPVASSSFRIYMLRTASLVPRSPNAFELGWRQAPRATVPARRIEDSTPQFAEMADPGTTFEGVWTRRAFFDQPDVIRSLGWSEALRTETLFESANRYAGHLLSAHRHYARQVDLGLLDSGLEKLQQRLKEVETAGGCLLPLGWGAGLVSKTPAEPGSEHYRQVLRQVPLFTQAIQSGLPFPKTRRVVFLNNQPAALPGWVLLETLDPTD